MISFKFLFLSIFVTVLAAVVALELFQGVDILHSNQPIVVKTNAAVITQALVSDTRVNQTPLAISLSPSPTLTPTETPTPTPLIRTTSMDSPDGSRVVTMETVTTWQNTTYSFYTSNADESDNRAIFSKTLDGAGSLSVPFNTWSPNNQYFYIQESDAEGDHYYVFNGNGDAFANSALFVNVNEIFAQRFPGTSLLNVPGWGPNLLIINTRTSEGTQGPSYWVDIINQTFTQLATHYN